MVSELGPAQPQLVLLVVLLLVTGVKQSQLLDLSLGLGLEFDKNEENTKNKDEPKNKDNLKNPVKKRCFDYTIKNQVPSKKVYLLLFIYCMARLLLL